jgi:hypothetical protein
VALPCGHRRDSGQAEATRVRLVETRHCPICPASDGTPRALFSRTETCRACFLSAGACGCCSYHWTVNEGHARQVIAAVNHGSPA